MRYPKLYFRYFFAAFFFFINLGRSGFSGDIELHVPVDSLQIVYLANVNANYENCHCGEHPLGGLDRVITIVKQWKRTNPHLLLFDGGDFLNAYPYPELNRVILSLYRLLQPEFLCLGDQELQAGNLSFQKELFKHGRTILGSNVNLTPFKPLRQVRIRLKSRHIRIFSFLDSSAFLWEKPAKDVHLSNRVFKAVYRQSLNQQVFRIVIFHGERERVGLFVKRYPNIDLLLLAHSQMQEFSRKTRPWILGVGTDSEYVTRISLNFSGPKAMPSIQIKSVPVELNVRPDRQARSIIDEFKSRTE